MKSVEPQDRQKWTFSVLLYDIQCEKMISNDSINIKSRVKILHMFSLSFALYHKIRKIANKKFNWEKTLINHVWKRNQAWKNEWKRGVKIFLKGNFDVFCDAMNRVQFESREF